MAQNWHHWDFQRHFFHKCTSVVVYFTGYLLKVYLELVKMIFAGFNLYILKIIGITSTEWSKICPTSVLFGFKQTFQIYDLYRGLIHINYVRSLFVDRKYNFDGLNLYVFSIFWLWRPFPEQIVKVKNGRYTIFVPFPCYICLILIMFGMCQ